MKNIVGLKELRQNTLRYITQVQAGHSFIIMKQSKPLFKISPIEDDQWEEVVDFTKMKKGGVNVNEILARL